MKCLPTIVLVFALVLALTPGMALADEALPELAGAWVAESMDGEPPPAGAKMVMKFQDAKTLRFEVTYEGETEIETLKYEATKDGDKKSGKMTIYFDVEKKPEGDKVIWKIKDGKLELNTEQGEVLLFKRE